MEENNTTEYHPLWSIIEAKLFKLPQELKTILEESGFDNIFSLSDITEDDLDDIANYTKTNITINGQNIMLRPGHKKLIKKLGEFITTKGYEYFTQELIMKRSASETLACDDDDNNDSQQENIFKIIDVCPSTSSLSSLNQYNFDEKQCSLEVQLLQQEQNDEKQYSLEDQLSQHEQHDEKQTVFVIENVPQINNTNAKENSVKKQRKKRGNNQLSFKDKLLELANNYLSLYYDTPHRIEEVEVHFVKGTIKGIIICRLCKARVKVSSHSMKCGQQRWIITNFYKHFQKHHKNFQRNLNIKDLDENNESQTKIETLQIHRLIKDSSEYDEYEELNDDDDDDIPFKLSHFHSIKTEN